MLIDDFNQIIKDKVDEIEQNVKLDLKKDINNESDYYRNLFLNLMNFKHRTLYGKSYYIICSKELKENLLKIPKEYVRNFHKILEIISSKGNLIPYQSRYIESVSFDRLFNNYGINHAHLSSKHLNNSIFMKGSDYLLFFITYGDTVFLIDIDRHPKSDEWIDKKYAEIVLNNWPFIYESRKLKSVTDFTPKPRSRKDEYEMSKCVSLLKNINGNVYVPFFFGIGSNGIPTHHIIFYDNIIKTIYKLEKKVTDKNYIKNLGLSCSKNCEFKLILKNNKLYLLEQTKMKYFDLGLQEIF